MATRKIAAQELKIAAQELAGNIGTTPCGFSAAAMNYFAYHSGRLEALLNRQLVDESAECIEGEPPPVVPANNRNIRLFAAPLTALCAHCPQRAVAECGELGVLSELTGVAGGVVLQRGRVKLPEHRSRGPERGEGSAA